MWLNDRTAWTWRRLWALEEAFWDLAPKALASAAARPALAQAARELLLAQASDWQFIISTGAVVDYAERRFTQHCDDRSEEHTSELQSRLHLVCRLLLEKKKPLPGLAATHATGQTVTHRL